ncbi:MAG: HD domain-containing protein [Alphaproteobacteria bacterium]|nr:HD domain-containing protein [Alphaproteobacteria bacterium]
MCASYKNSVWPDSFDFETDPICQERFKPFIEDELSQLKSFDGQRPENITYIFHEHAKRVSNDVYKTCLHMGLGETVAHNMKLASLPHDIGKRLLPLELWDMEEKPTNKLKKFRRTHTLLGVQIVLEYFPDVDHPFKDLMIEIMAYHHEQMNGEGTHRIAGDKLSAPVRLMSIIEAYDGWRIWRPHYGERDISVPGVLNRMREEKGADIFDMEYFEAFAEMKMIEYNKELEMVLNDATL